MMSNSSCYSKSYMNSALTSRHVDQNCCLELVRGEEYVNYSVMLLPGILPRPLPVDHLLMGRTHSEAGKS